MASSQAFELDPAVIEEIADRLSGAIVARVIEVLREEGLSPRASEATAWLDAQEVARRLLGDKVADRIGPVWGLDATGEVRYKIMAEAAAGGPRLEPNHSPYYAPVPEPTIRTGVTAMTLAVLNRLGS